MKSTKKILWYALGHTRGEMTIIDYLISVDEMIFGFIERKATRHPTALTLYR